jgi:hypothetical protein
MEYSMKAIDTLYNGNYFRSRLEARWAVFFDALGVKYEYEPEGFKSLKGDMYLPDFYLPDTYIRGESKGVYIEIKPESYPKADLMASSFFSEPLVLFRGMPHANIWGSDYWGYKYHDSRNGYCGGYQLTPFWDNYMLFWMCGKCRASKIEFSEGNYNKCHNCKTGGCNDDDLKIAVDIAIKKRFEHGY